MIIKISLLGITAAILALTLKKINIQASVMIIITAGIMILFMTYNDLANIVVAFKMLVNSSGIPSNYIALIVKVIGIGYVSEFAAAAIKDLGESALASKIEFAGKVSVMVLALPLFTDLLDLITGLMP